MIRRALPTRRRLLLGAAPVALAAPMIWTRRASAAQQLTVRTPGGSFDEVKKKTVYDPFREATGIEIVPVAATAAKLLAMFKAGQVDIDVIDTGDDVLLQLEKAGALEPMPYKSFTLTNPDDIDPGLAGRMLGPRGLTEPEEVAALFAFLASDEARSVTGAIYTIDNGLTVS